MGRKITVRNPDHPINKMNLVGENVAKMHHQLIIKKKYVINMGV